MSLPACQLPTGSSPCTSLSANSSIMLRSYSSIVSILSPWMPAMRSLGHPFFPKVTKRSTAESARTVTMLSSRSTSDHRSPITSAQAQAAECEPPGRRQRVVVGYLAERLQLLGQPVFKITAPSLPTPGRRG